MSIKDLFNSDTKTYKRASLGDLTRDVESEEYVRAYAEQKQRYEPAVNLLRPENIAHFGSAERYYENSIKHIYNDYPYDGSLKEKIQWHLSSSYLDNYIFDHAYPRTNGYALLSADGWGTKVESVTVSNISNYYGAPASASYEYIKILGNAHPDGNKIPVSFPDAGGKSNRYDLLNHRNYNLELNLADYGTSVEFWLKKDAFDVSKTSKEVIFDLWNGEVSSSTRYGRLTIELSGTLASESPWRVTLQSGSSGFFNQQIGLNIAGTDSLNPWTHYAFTFLSGSDGILTKFYVNGFPNHTASFGSSSINEVTGAMVAYLGSLQTAPSGTTYTRFGSDMAGWGKLSASVDEFRYWKRQRTSEQIGRYWFDQVGGGTNTDTANTDLGVYYKFNEGIVGSASIDKGVLDYSGRISNGTWIGYDSHSRSTGSAIVLADAGEKEFKDPIIRRDHPDVKQFLDGQKLLGREFDYVNNSSIYNSIPDWIVEEDNDGHLSYLVQIISSYFDDLYLQTQQLPRNKLRNYFTDGPSGSSYKPLPFADHLITSMGMIAPELFSDVTELEQLAARSDKILFDNKLYNIKNTIYTNIYNNLVEIYKSKGTEKAFRNLIRCFGVDDELIKLNLYANNETFFLKDNYQPISRGTRVIDFNDPDRFMAVVTHHSSSKSYLSASHNLELEKGMALTVECEVIFPKKINEDHSGFFPTHFTTASIFGANTATGSTSAFAFAPADVSNFQVFAVRPEKKSKHVKFMLTGTAGGYVPELSSSFYADVYENEKWNLALRIAPSKYPLADLVTGTTSGYTVNLYGVNVNTDIVVNEFELTGTIPDAQGLEILKNPKRFFIGSHRQNTTGSILQKTDVKISSFRVWMDYVENEALRQHIIANTNYGAMSPYKNAYLFQTYLSGTRVPQIDTLAINWDFETLTGSNLAGEFVAEDFSSGSDASSHYAWLSSVTTTQHKPHGYLFPPNSSQVCDLDYGFSYRRTLPEVLNSADAINIITRDEETFTREHRPINHFWAFEKSMYQEISNEMIDIFATIKEFNNLIGEPVNRYRQSYKHLEKLRQLFFERISNVPDIEKFVDFYKWIDDAVSVMVMKLVPASANTSDRIRTMVESHVLERNKYWTKFPTLEIKYSDPEGALEGINRHLYNWKFGHAPIPLEKGNNCFWWKERVERSDPHISSGDSNVDDDKNQILSASMQVLNRSFTTPYHLDLDQSKFIAGGVNSPKNKRYKLYSTELRPNSSDAIDITLESSSICQDVYNPSKKTRISTKAASASFGNSVKGELITPFTVYSSSAGNSSFEISDEKEITNLHQDGYGDLFEVPMQGPFTSQHVGGLQHRHVGLTKGRSERPEGFRLKIANNVVSLMQPEKNEDGVIDHNLVTVRYYRDELAKRPVNIRNILNATGTVPILGNYNKRYEIIQTSNRKTNNHWWVSNQAGTYTGDRPVQIEFDLDSFSSSFGSGTPFITGSDSFPDYLKVDRGRHENVIVERFSAPGSPETSGDALGGPGLDQLSVEYSVYNNLNYRNLTVRQPLREFLTQHCGRHGFDSTVVPVSSNTFKSIGGLFKEVGSPSASFHKVQRNSIRKLMYSASIDIDNLPDGGGGVLTSSVRNNYFVWTPIPQSDAGYAWISASAENHPSSSGIPFGYATDARKDITGSQFITFLTASDFGSYGFTGDGSWGAPASESPPGRLTRFKDTFLVGNFVGLNYHVTDPVTASDNNLGYSLDTPYWVGKNSGHGTGPHPNVRQYMNRDVMPTLSTAHATIGEFPILFNTLMLKRNGPYGYPSWKQIRTGDHPVARNQRKTNEYQYIINDDKLGRFLTEEARLAALRTHGPVKSIKILKRFTESPITSKYSPIKHQLSLDETDAVIVFKHTYANDITYFGNNEIVNNLLLRNTKRQLYDELTDLYIHSDISGEENPINHFVSLEYKETVHPKPQNAFLKKTRDRENYNTLSELGWNSSRTTRQEDNIANSMNETASVRSSRWILDGRLGGQNLVAGTWYLPGESSAATASFVKGAVFKLQQGDVEANRNRQSGFDGSGELLNDYSQFHQGTSSWVKAAPLYARRDLVFTSLGTPGEKHVLVGGDAKWEAAEQSGLAPWYDSYADFSQVIKRIGKDYTIIPEFRISDHIEFYINQEGGNFLADIPRNSFLRLEGGKKNTSLTSSFWADYSHTDFMRYFNVIATDHEQTDIGSARRIRLRCRAIKKFRPREGFYPAQRALQLATLFSKSYGPITSLTGDEGNFRTMLQPFYAPGILFNTIKSGIAVDYPIMTGSADGATILEGGTGRYKRAISGMFRYSINRYHAASGPLGLYAFHEQHVADSWNNKYTIAAIDDNFSYRVPFEAIIDPFSYLKDVKIVDNEPHLSASLNSTASFDGTPGLTHKLAMSNFLAETINFFIKDGRLNFFASTNDKEETFGIARRSYTYDDEGRRPVLNYVMDLSLREGSKTTGYRIHYVPFDATTSSLDMYTRPAAFGPPVYAGGYGLSTSKKAMGYAPFTPPYYDGVAKVRISFSPTEAKQYSVEEIISELTYEYSASAVVNSKSGFSDGVNRNVANAMQVTASVTVDGTVKNKRAIYDNNQVVGFEDDPNAGNHWVIQTKMETPVLDFTDASVTLPVSGSGSVPVGMWHQYGKIPANSNQGIFLELTDVPDSEKIVTQFTSSLIDLVGFQRASKQIGQIAESIFVKEAIIAIPYVIEKRGKTRFGISRPVIESVLAGNLGSGKTRIDGAIIDMVAKMQDYVFPPQLDFLTNLSVIPFAMYIFEFDYEFKKGDLADIWQNLAPAKTLRDDGFSIAEASIEHSLFARNFLGQLPKGDAGTGEPNLRWEVFKVKQKADIDYYEKVVKRGGSTNILLKNIRMKLPLKQKSGDRRRTIKRGNVEIQRPKGSGGGGGGVRRMVGKVPDHKPLDPGEITDYSYNWPYDYFSIVELVKLDATMIFGANGPSRKVRTTDEPDSSTEDDGSDEADVEAADDTGARAEAAVRRAQQQQG